MTTKQIGTKLRKIRQQNSLSLQKASQRMGISPATLWKLECGSGPSKLQAKTKKAIEEFVKNEGTQEQPVTRFNFVPAVSTESTGEHPLVKLQLKSLIKGLQQLNIDLNVVQSAIMELGIAKINS